MERENNGKGVGIQNEGGNVYKRLEMIRTMK